MNTRPQIAIASAEIKAAVQAFVTGLQAGYDRRDADVLAAGQNTPMRPGGAVPAQGAAILEA